MMMDDIFEEEKANKPRKKIKKDLSKSEVFGNEIDTRRKNSEADVPDYLDNFLQHSRGAVFINGDDNTNNKPHIKKKKIIKKIVKRKKLSKSDSFVINSTLFRTDDQAKKAAKLKETLDKIQKEKQERERKEKEKEKEKEEKSIEDQKKKVLIRIFNKKQKLEKESEYLDTSINSIHSRDRKLDNKKVYINKTINSSKNIHRNINISKNTINKNIINKNILNRNFLNNLKNRALIKTGLASNNRVKLILKNRKRTKSISSREELESKINFDKSIKKETREKSAERSFKKQLSINSDKTSSRNGDNSEEEKINYTKRKKVKKVKKNLLKEQLEKFEHEQRLILLSKFINLIQKQIIINIKNMLKIIFIYKKIRDYQNKCVTKISSIFRGYLTRQKAKLEYLIMKILKIREDNASKISSYYKMTKSKKQTKNILSKAKNSYAIYSSLTNNKILYFKYKNQTGLEDNLYFEFCPLLNCFVLFISKREKEIKKIIEGHFYNENYHKLIDPIYEVNQNGENIINISKIFKKADYLKEKDSKILYKYIKIHRTIRRERIDDYEERKRKIHEDDISLTRSHSFFAKKVVTREERELSRSKSFMKLKSKKSKGILKPSKSYMNLRCEEKKIHFGNARIKKYHNSKK